MEGKTININIEHLIKDMHIHESFKTLEATAIADAVKAELLKAVKNSIITFENVPKTITGITLIAIERHEQIVKHGRTVERDVKENCFSQLTDGAIGVLMTKRNMRDIPSHWNKEVWSKMIGKTRKERLIIAGALIAAEIDRMIATGETE